MFYTTKGIVLHNIKYADKKVISKIYTKELGIISINSIIGTSSKTKISMSLLQPLSQVEIQFNYKENNDLQNLKEVKLIYQYQSIHLNFHKLCICQFINEILLKCLKEQSKNDELFDFIINLFQWLDDTETNFNNTHVYFLFQLSKFLGFYPLNNFDEDHPYFDLMEGRFSNDILVFPLGLGKEDSNLVATLFQVERDNFNFLSKSNRDSLLDILMLYYKYHLPGFNNLKSYYVLKEVING